MAQIHWVGTGLSAVPGLRRLIERGHGVTVWNRSVEKAETAVAGLTGDFSVHAFTLDKVQAALAPGDVLVSMLPGDFHVALAEICIAAGAHFVSSSYISDAMRDLAGAASAKAVCLVNEVGLDPGIDHSMAHALVADYRQSDAYDGVNVLSFLSYCGGLPKVKNDFLYKFSWSPLGVLKALKSPSKSIWNGAQRDVNRPWDAVTPYRAALPGGAEVFEVYPNRDSLPFMADYHFDPDWRVDTFVRGTLRYDGWAAAWADIFAVVETLSGPEGDARLKAMSDDLWQRYAYGPDEADRVVLCVDLKADRDGATVWHKGYVLDAYGDERGSAMARLVSIPLSLAVEAVKNGEIAAGVSAAPSAPGLVQRWLDTVTEIADHFERQDHQTP